jgi:endonuclease/exonuclease/phosphatase family metal-dependent hydrolase
VKRLRAALLALCCVAPAAHAEPFELSVLTYNIHGLPSWIARDDPPARIPQILSIAQPYDLVLLQEDFAHHDAVVAASPFAHLVRGNPAWLEAPLFQGAGLTILSRFAATESAREPYDVCNGWLSAANDCFGHKGFVMARLALPDGAAIDAWNTHLDAGDTDADRAVRADQLDRLAAAIETQSADRAVVVGGDFNLHWDEPRDRALLERFATRLGLAIAAMTPAGGWDSRLDYLLTRAAADRCLSALEAGKDERLLDAAGRPLSDHPAIFARLQLGSGCK